MKTDQKKSYIRFFAMILTSSIAMFLLMYSHSMQILDHAWFSETRLFMTTIMAGSMIIVMLSFMLHMYENKKLNAGIFAGGFLLIVLGLFLVRSQVTVSDSDYMEGMIPHHSIAVLTSERVDFKDVRVKKLAKEILDAQRKEIKEMEWLINDIKENGIAETDEEATQRPVPVFSSTPE